MSSGRTSWWAKDAGWFRRERVVVLIDEFGPAGAVVIDWLCCEAASQDGYLDGTVKAGCHAVARATRVKPDRVESIVARAAELELLEDLDIGPLVFTCRISGWRADRVRALAGARKERFGTLRNETERS